MPKVPPLHPLASLSGFGAEQIARFLHIPLTDEQLRLVGEISALWNSVQCRLQHYVWQLADWTGEIGPLVTGNMQAAALVVLARSIVDNTIKNEFAVACAAATIDLFDELRIRRHKVIHALPALELDGSARKLSELTAKRGRPLMLPNHQVTTTELVALLDDIALLAVAVEGLLLQQVTLEHWHESWSSGLHECLEQSMLVPIAHVQARQAALNRQRSNTPRA